MTAAVDRMGGERVLLVSMPFGAVERPSLGLGLIQAHCRRAGVDCETIYLNLAFAERLGLDDYMWLGGELPYTAFAGDWLFAEALYGPAPEADARFVENVLQRTWHLSDTDVERIWRLRAEVIPFLDQCLDSVPWGDFTLIGFTSVFQQNIASLALAARVKAAHADVTIAFGGANWEEAMGVALYDQFEFVDLAFSGEADRSFPAVLLARRAGQSVDGIAGLISGRRATGAAGETPALVRSPVVERLDDLPVPDFDPYFLQLRPNPATASVTPTLLVETARGCWWGERSHCTFCGLNGATMAFRSKSPDRVVGEIRFLHQRHGVSTFSVVDDILDMRYFRTVLPKLADARLGTDFFWEVKATLTRRQVRQLRDAGALYIQPGVESLSDHVLALMRKGTTGLRNIELLKWCKEYGVKPLWNLLYGFPGETAADYEETEALIHAIWHLDPPTGYGPIRLDRFSPYHEDPKGFGMVNVRPMPPFIYLYPFDPAVVAEIAYYFDFDYSDGRRDDEYAGDCIELTKAWMADTDRGMLSVRPDGEGDVLVVDTRRGVVDGPVRAVLQGWKAAVYRACDRSQLFDTLAALTEVAEAGVSDEEVRAFLVRCATYQLMVEHADRWLSLAVHTPERDEGAEVRVPIDLVAVG